MFIAQDGIVDKTRYDRAKVKVAFLLKEVNYPNMAENWAYTDWLYEQALERRRDGEAWVESGDFHKTFSNVCRWLACVETPDITYLECEDYRRHKHLLAQAAVVNIHKGGGESSSNWREISRIAGENHIQLRQQIEEINPDLVICGGTFWFAHQDIYPGVKTSRLPSGAGWFAVDGTVFVEMPHPGWFSVDRSILFAYFKAVYHDLLPIMEEKKNTCTV